MAKIDTISVAGVSYDINLPTSATPSISSLTVTGNLTVSGTSNLSVVRFLDDEDETASYYADIEYSSSQNNLKIGFKETSRLGTAEENNYSWYLGFDRGGGGTTVDFNSAYVEDIFDLSVTRNLTTSNLTVNNSFTYDGRSYTFPTNSGMLALVSQIPYINETMRLPILDYNNRIVRISSTGTGGFPTITLSNGWDDAKLCGTVFIRTGENANPDVILLGTISPFKAYTGQASTGFMYIYYPTVNTALSGVGQYEYKMWVRINFQNRVPQSYEINVCRRSSNGGAWTQIVDDSSIGNLYYHMWKPLTATS